MSTPPFLDPPERTSRCDVGTSRGGFAALAAQPESARQGTALLVPGFTGSKEDFIAVLHPVLEQGFRPVAVDLRGQFETPGPAEAEAYSLDGWAEEVLALAETLPGPVHLVGHSFGGLVARNAVLRSPGSFASVTFLCSGSGALPVEQHERLRLFGAVLASQGAAALWAALQAMEEELGSAGTHDPEVAAFLGRRFTSHSPGALLTMAELLVTECPRDDELRATSLPMHVVTGEQDDAWTPAEQEDRAAALGVPFSVISDAGHSPAVERPVDTAAVLADFWTQGG